MRSSLRLLNLPRKHLGNTTLSDVVLNVLPEAIRKSGKPRNYFERAILSPENFSGLSEKEKAVYLDLVKRVLDKAFIN